MAIMAQTIAPISFSQTQTFFEGDWHEGNVAIMGPRTHAAWLGVDRLRRRPRVRRCHARPRPALARMNRSAERLPAQAGGRRSSMGSTSRGGGEEVRAGGALHPADVLGRHRQRRRGASSTRDHPLVPLPLRGADARYRGRAITLSPFRRPTLETAPVDAKAGCLYPEQRRAPSSRPSRAASTTAC